MNLLTTIRFTKKLTNGFSLIELTISLLVIGLILGSILKGQDLIIQARLQKTFSQIVSYQLAYLSFKETYQALPGDFDRAAQYWGEGIRNGNQNGYIEGKGREARTEATAFWQHLACANLITFNSSAPEASDQILEFGSNLPPSPLGGGFTVEDSPDSLKGLWLILGNPAGVRGTGGLLTPEQASFLNRKLDDGHPLSGRVQSREGEGIPLGQCVKRNAYQVSVKEKTCVLYIQLD